MKKNLHPSHMMLIAAIFLAACSSPSTETKTAETVDSSVAKKTPVKSALAFKEAGLGNAWKNYNNLREALVKGDAAAAQTEAGFFAETLIDVNGSGEAVKQAQDLAATPDLSGQRKQFALLNESFIGMVKKSGVSGGELYVQHCPMFAKGKGADWLSAQKAVENPYYGKEMPDCGSIKETIK